MSIPTIEPEPGRQSSHPASRILAPLIPLAMLMAVALPARRLVTVWDLAPIFLVAVGFAARRGGLASGLAGAVVASAFVLANPGSSGLAPGGLPIRPWIFAGAAVALGVAFGLPRRREGRPDSPLIEAIPQIVWTATPDGRVDYHNPRWVEYTGQESALVADQGWREVVHPEDLAPSIASWNEAVRDGVTFGRENRLRAADGSYRWHLVRAVPVRDASGEVVRWCGTCTDIDEGKRAEQALRMAEALSRGLTDQSPLSKQILDAEGRTLRVNAAWERLWGVTLGELAGYNIMEDERLEAKGLTPLLRRALAGESGASPPTFYVPDRGSRAGEEIWVRAVVYPVKDEAGAVREVVLVNEDITERVRAEEALHRQLAFDGAVTESMAEGLFALDLGGLITFLNPAAERMLGWLAAELIGLRLHEAIHYRRADGTPFPVEECELMASFREGRSLRGEETFIRRDGVAFPISFASSPILVEGQAVGVVLTFHDITEAKQAEASQRFLARAGSVLASSLDYEETLATVARLAIPDAADWCAFRIVGDDGVPQRLVVAHADPGKVELADELFRRYPPDPNSAHGPHHVARTGRPDFLPEITDEMLATAAVDAEHLRLLRATGFSSYMCVPLLARGKTVGVLTLVMAESGRRYRPEDLAMAESLARKAALAVDNARLFREAQEAVRLQDEGRALTESLLAAAPMAVAFLDADLRYVRVNRKLAEFNGVSADAHLGRSFGEIVPEMAALYVPLLREVLESGRPLLDLELDLEPPGRPGEPGHWQGTAYPAIDGGGRVVGVGVILSDVTARKRAEIRLREAIAEAEAAGEAKNQFLAVLSHELRTPLTPVLVGVTALLDDPETPASVRPTLEVTRRNVELEARLIDDLLDVTRIAQGKLRLDRRPVDAHDLVRRAVEICRDEVASKGLRLDLDLESEWHHVEGDPARVQQIVWNLVKNAAKFTPGGGTISVRSRNTEDPDGGRLLVEVRDTGIGIGADLLPRIFDAFDQGDPTVTQRFGGLGLGLAISRSLAEAHGGSLAVASDGPGLGSTFTLALPTILEPADFEGDAEDTPSRAAMSESRRHILLVEDNADTLRVMARLLRGRGHRVATATSVASGLGAAEAEGPFDLVISDIGLPDGSGLDLMRQVGVNGPLRGIALSGYGMEDDLRKCLEVGFHAHLTKPVSFQALEAAIRRVTADLP